MKHFKTKAIAILRGGKNALVLLLRRDWREFMIRLRISLGVIDLRNDSSETITERTYYYADSGGLEFDRLMAHFPITTEDAIVDFGCGKGGVLISLSKYPFAKIAGVEISPDLVAIAEKNVKALKIPNIEIHCCDAAEFTSLDEFNYYYMFDPFPDLVMKDVLRNLEKSVGEHPRKVTVVYLNPSCHDLFEKSTVFNKVKELSHFEHQCFVYSNIN